MTTFDQMLVRSLTRRSAVALGAAAVAASLLPLSGCSTASQNKVHLVVKVPRTGHDVVFDDDINQVETVIQAMADDFASQYEGAPVEVEVVVFEQNQYDNAVVGSFDTGKAPDVLYGDYFNMSTYIHTGRVVPLDDIVTPAIRDDIFEHLWEMSTIEDRVYMMPYLSRQNVLGYNKQMFRDAGLEHFVADGEITAWSLDE